MIRGKAKEYLLLALIFLANRGALFLVAYFATVLIEASNATPRPQWINPRFLSTLPM